MTPPVFEKTISYIKEQFPGQNPIPLHVPTFNGNEKKYVLDTIDSTFVSSVGAYVNKFEDMMCQVTGAAHCVAMVNGTNALHMGLLVSQVVENDEVLTQSLTFVASCNAISYIKAIPVFIDVDGDTLGMAPHSLEKFLETNTELRFDGFCYNKNSGRRVKACVPMHTFGFPCRIDEIVKICNHFNITVVEDAAESIGSFYKERHTGTFGEVGIFSFNGNKTITSGGGGALITNDKVLASKAKHLTTQAKVSHPWNFYHDDIGYNYRMPNLNAALACAQLEQLWNFIEDKRQLGREYSEVLGRLGLNVVKELPEARANYWLNAIIFSDKTEKETFLQYAVANGVMSRPIWELMHRLPMFIGCETTELRNSEWIADCIVNIPSSVRV